MSNYTCKHDYVSVPPDKHDCPECLATNKTAQSDAPSAESMSEFRKALNCLYIAVDAHVADDVVRRANAALEHLTKRAETAEAALSEARKRAQQILHWVNDDTRELCKDGLLDLNDVDRLIEVIEGKRNGFTGELIEAGASGAAGNKVDKAGG